MIALLAHNQVKAYGGQQQFGPQQAPQQDPGQTNINNNNQQGIGAGGGAGAGLGGLALALILAEARNNQPRPDPRILFQLQQQQALLNNFQGINALNGLNVLGNGFRRLNGIPAFNFQQGTIVGPRFFFKRGDETVSEEKMVEKPTEEVKTEEMVDKKDVEKVEVKPKMEMKKTTGVNCDYDMKKTMMTCTMLTEKVECEVLEDNKNKTFGFPKFAIAPANISDATMDRFALFPLREDNVWMNRKIRDIRTSEEFEFSLHKTFNVTDDGFALKDESCWTKLVDLFSKVKENETIMLEPKMGTNNTETKPEEVKIWGMINMMM